MLLTEKRISYILKESIKKILFENDNVVEETSSLTFDIIKHDSRAINHFLRKIAQLNAWAQKYNCGEVNVETKEVTKGVKDKYGKIIPTQFIEIKVIPTLTEIKVEGFEFLGVITPMKVYIDQEEKEHIMVSLSSEFEGNDYYEKLLKDSSMTMKCDHCNRERMRGLYLCFINKNTGEIKKMGNSCAKKFFGIDVSSKLKEFFSALSNLGNDPYVRHDNEGFEDGRYDNPVLSDLWSLLDKHDEENLENMIIRGTTAIIEHGVNCHMKSSMGSAIGFENLIEKIKLEATDKHWHVNYDILHNLLEKAEQKYPESFALYRQAKELMYDFLKGGAKFFYYWKPESAFQKNLQDAGLVITGGVLQKKRMRFSKYFNLVPYCVQEYFKYKAANDPTAGPQPVPIEPFDGAKDFIVKIDTVDKKQTRYGKDYYFIIGITEENEIVKWNMINDQPNFKRGDIINITATYNSRFNYLDDVKIISNEPEPESNVEKEEEEVIEYPDNGYRYRNSAFTIVKLKDTFLVVKNNTDKCEYYIGNITGGFSYYDDRRYKFDLDNLNVGSIITIDGTVKSYTKKDGSIGYSLIRVKGLPKSNKLYGSYDDDEDYY